MSLFHGFVCICSIECCEPDVYSSEVVCSVFCELNVTNQYVVDLVQSVDRCVCGIVCVDCAVIV